MSEREFLLRAMAQASQNPNGYLSPQEVLRIGRECFGALVVEASTLDDFMHIAERLHIQFVPCDEHFWELSAGTDVSLSKDAEELWNRIYTTIKCLRYSKSKFLINAILVDRILANSEALNSKNMMLCSEYPVFTGVPDGRGWINGTADYVLGFSTSSARSTKGTFVVVDAKSPSDFSRAYCQVVAYMLGVQQEHQVGTGPNPMTDDTTYGVVSDGTRWGFFKLEGNKLYLSRPYNMMTFSSRGDIYRFVDYIIKSSISIAPFPANH